MDNISLLIAAPVLNLQLIIDGLLIGSIFALAAYGLALVWGVTSVKNLAQGDFVMLGGYISWWLSKPRQIHIGIPFTDIRLVEWATPAIHPILSMPIVIAVMFGFGWALYFLIIRWVIGRDLFTSLLATFGIALVVQQLLNVAFGPEVRVADAGLDTWSLFGGQVTVAQIKVVSFVLAGLLAVLVVSFMKHSRMGQAIRATSQDPRAARVMGIDTERVYAFTFALNAAICGAAGVLIAMIWVIQPFIGISHSIRAFVIVTAAGLGNLPGVIMAGLGIGVIEQYGGFILGADLQQFTVLAMLLAVLIWRQFEQSRQRQALQ